jgi:hypothetical protein
MKEKVILQHKTFGQVEVTDSWTTISNDELRYVVVKSEAFQGTKKLLVDSDYWLTAADEVERVFLDFARMRDSHRKQALAKDHKKDIRAASLNLQQAIAAESFDAQPTELAR